jgi:hypothetical protein
MIPPTLRPTCHVIKLLIVQHRQLLSSPPNQLTQGLIWHYGVRKEIQLESLALLAVLILLAVYSSGLIAFISSWFRNRVSEVITYIFSSISVVAGTLLGFSLRDGNGIAIALIPITLGIVSVWNLRRRKKDAAVSS